MYDYAKPESKKAPTSMTKNKKKPKSANEVVQMAKWQWNQAAHRWVCLSSDAGFQPAEDGKYDGEIFDDTPVFDVHARGLLRKEEMGPWTRSPAEAGVTSAMPKGSALPPLNLAALVPSYVSGEDILELKHWIMRMKSHIINKRYNVVISELNESASGNGYPISALRNIDATIRSSEDNMFFKDSLQIKIHIPAKKEAYLLSDEHYYMTELLRAVEEYIHAYQFFSQSFICDDTTTFLKSKGISGYNPAYDEADVLAMYHNAGLPVAALSYTDPYYRDRELYWKWKTNPVKRRSELPPLKRK